MIEKGIESLEWLVAAQHQGDEDIFVPIAPAGFSQKAKRRHASINNLSKLVQPSQPASKHTG